MWFYDVLCGFVGFNMMFRWFNMMFIWFYIVFNIFVLYWLGFQITIAIPNDSPDMWWRKPSISCRGLWRFGTTFLFGFSQISFVKFEIPNVGLAWWLYFCHEFVGARGVVRCCSFGFVLHWRCLVFVSFGGYLYSSLVASRFLISIRWGDYCSNMVTDDPLGSSHFCDLSIDLDIFKHRCSLFQTHLTGKLLKIFWARVAEKQATWRVDAADSSGEGDIWVLCWLNCLLLKITSFLIFKG